MMPPRGSWVKKTDWRWDPKTLSGPKEDDFRVRKRSYKVNLFALYSCDYGSPLLVFQHPIRHNRSKSATYSNTMSCAKTRIAISGCGYICTFLLLWFSFKIFLLTSLSVSELSRISITMPQLLAKEIVHLPTSSPPPSESGSVVGHRHWITKKMNVVESLKYELRNSRTIMHGRPFPEERALWRMGVCSSWYYCPVREYEDTKFGGSGED